MPSEVSVMPVCIWCILYGSFCRVYSVYVFMETLLLHKVIFLYEDIYIYICVDDKQYMGMCISLHAYISFVCVSSRVSLAHHLL